MSTDKLGVLPEAGGNEARALPKVRVLEVYSITELGVGVNTIISKMRIPGRGRIAKVSTLEASSSGKLGIVEFHTAANSRAPKGSFFAKLESSNVGLLWNM